MTREEAEDESVIETEIVKLSDVLEILDNIGKGGERMNKEQAITIIESHKAHWQRLLREKICDETEGRETIEGFDMAISALKGGWIPITEGMELPEHDVICCDNEGNIALGYLYFDEEENQIACDRDPYVMFGIVAYMELPEPYKKGE